MLDDSQEDETSDFLRWHSLPCQLTVYCFNEQNGNMLIGNKLVKGNFTRRQLLTCMSSGDSIHDKIFLQCRDLRLLHAFMLWVLSLDEKRIFWQNSKFENALLWGLRNIAIPRPVMLGSLLWRNLSSINLQKCVLEKYREHEEIIQQNCILAKVNSYGCNPVDKLTEVTKLHVEKMALDVDYSVQSIIIEYEDVQVDEHETVQVDNSTFKYEVFESLYRYEVLPMQTFLSPVWCEFGKDECKTTRFEMAPTKCCIGGDVFESLKAFKKIGCSLDTKKQLDTDVTDTVSLAKMESMMPNDNVLDDHFYEFRQDLVREDVLVVQPSLDSFIEKIVMEKLISREERFCCEMFRLESFKTFPRSVLSGAVRLAKAGFWYTGNGAEVACFSCNIKLSDWTLGQNPFERHQAESPECDFVNGREERNVPMGREENPFSQDGRNLEAPGLQHGDLADGLPNDLPPEVDRVMRIEMNRIRTFTGWPASAPVFPDELARNGFSYTGSEDRVKCAFCAVILRDWEPGDRVANEHRSHSPTCIFVRNPNSPNTGNVVLGSENTVADGHSFDIVPGNDHSVLSDPATASALGIDLERPRSGHYSLFERRLDSFREWPLNHCQKKVDLSEAGFYFIGNGDNVKCFFCDGGLRNWEPEDDPMTEHARWFPRCNFVREKMGEEFIRNITEHFDHFYPELVPREQRVAPLDVVNISGSGVASVSNLPGVEYTVEPREIKARMDTDKVRMVIRMGYKRSVIKQALENQLKRTGDDFPSAEALLEAILRIEAGEDELPLPQEGASAAATAAPPISRPPPVKNVEQTAKPAAQSAVARSSSPAVPRSAPKQEPRPTPQSTARSADLGAQSLPASVGEKAKEAKKTEATLLTSSEPRKDEGKELPRLGSASVVGSEDSSVIEEENRYLKEQRQCKICMDNEVNVVFLPCGHLVCCQECGLSLRNCPICRSAIRGTVKTFMS